MTEDIEPKVKLALIDNEIGLYKNTLYQMNLRYRVNTRIQADKAVLDNIKEEMVKIEAALDVLGEVREEVVKQIDAADKGKSP